MAFDWRFGHNKDYSGGNWEAGMFINAIAKFLDDEHEMIICMGIDIKHLDS